MKINFVLKSCHCIKSRYHCSRTGGKKTEEISIVVFVTYINPNNCDRVGVECFFNSHGSENRSLVERNLTEHLFSHILFLIIFVFKSRHIRLRYIIYFNFGDYPNFVKMKIIFTILNIRIIIILLLCSV